MKRSVLVVFLFILANVLASVGVVFLARMSANIMISDTHAVFDPLITIAYLMVFHFLALVYQPRQETMGKLLLLVLLLSFSTEFFKGAVLIYILFFLFRKTNLI